jgi:hypothetical protein
MDDWRKQAKCRGADVSRWYPDRGTNVIEVQRICNECPAKWDCMTHAIARPEQFGIWAGAGERPRKYLRRFYRECAHQDRGVVFGCRCEYCLAVREHFQRLEVLAETGRGPSPAVPTFGPDATHGRKSTYKRGCDCAPCRAAMGKAAS